jgi:hypothetical protein
MVRIQLLIFLSALVTLFRSNRIIPRVRNFLQTAVLSGVIHQSFSNPAFAYQPSSWSDKIQFESIKTFPDNPIPKVGETIAVRFRGEFKGTVFDDTFNTKEPYYFRFGVGNVVKGLDESIAHMHL